MARDVRSALAKSRRVYRARSSCAAKAQLSGRAYLHASPTTSISTTVRRREYVIYGRSTYLSFGHCPCLEASVQAPRRRLSQLDSRANRLWPRARSLQHTTSYGITPTWARLDIPRRSGPPRALLLRSHAISAEHIASGCSRSARARRATTAHELGTEPGSPSPFRSRRFEASWKPLQQSSSNPLSPTRPPPSARASPVLSRRARDLSVVSERN